MNIKNCFLMISAVFGFFTNLYSGIFFENLNNCKDEKEMLDITAYLLCSNQIDMNEKGDFAIRILDSSQGSFFKEILKDVTAIHVAAILNYYDFADFLLSNGADLKLLDAVGNSSMHYANVLGRDKIVGLFNSYQNKNETVSVGNGPISFDFSKGFPSACDNNQLGHFYVESFNPPSVPKLSQKLCMSDFHINREPKKLASKNAKKTKKYVREPYPSMKLLRELGGNAFSDFHSKKR